VAAKFLYAFCVEIMVESPSALDRALSVLRSGGCVVHATETCYGLACDLSNPDAVARMFRVKKRPEGQPVSALFPSVNEAKRYVEWNDRAEKLAEEYLPGPLTLILPRKENIQCPIFVTPPQKLKAVSFQLSASIGVRVSSHAWAQTLVTRFGRPISTTSANVHGEPSPYGVEEIVKQYEHCTEKPDLIVESGPLPFRKPSRIIDCTGTSDIQRRP